MLIRRIVLCLALVILAAGATMLHPSRAEEKEPSRAMVGKKIPNLTFKLDGGKKLALYDLQDKKAIILIFLSFDCPVSNSYAKPLADIHKRFHPYGVSLIGLTTNEDQTPAEVARIAKGFDIPFPVVIDHDFKAANALKANTTPEVFVLDGDYVLRYRGRIDNAFYARLKRNYEVSCHDLHQVLGELMSGRPVSVQATEPIGCPIPRQLKKVAKDGPVTFYRDVLPILQQKCQRCHRPGQVGQFSLRTFRQALNWAGDMKYFTQKGDMPPWKPVAGLPLHDERTLTKKELATLAGWVKCGTPKGDAGKAPPMPEFAQGWQLGKPDVVLSLPKTFELGPEGHGLYRCFVFPAVFESDKYVTAIEVLPGNPRVVQQAQLFVDTSGKAKKLELLEKEGKNIITDPHHQSGAPDQDKGPGYTVVMGTGFTPQGELGNWMPGCMPRPLPEGYGYFVPKRADIVLQIRYHRTGRKEHDQTKVGLYFAKKKTMRPYQRAILAGTQNVEGKSPHYFAIPAGADRFQVKGSAWATTDCRLFSLMPHIHLLGKEIRVTMTPPGGKKITLLEIRDWDYYWQECYAFKQPVEVKAGTRFDIEAVYDNSSNNPNNPYNPPRVLTYGEQTTNEMCYVYLGGGSMQPGWQLPLSVEPLHQK